MLYRAVYADNGFPTSDGMTQLQVARKFGTYTHPYWGGVTYRSESSDWGSAIDRQWHICSSSGKPLPYYRGLVSVDFEQNLDEDTYEPYGAMRATFKDREVW